MYLSKQVHVAFFYTRLFIRILCVLMILHPLIQSLLEYEGKKKYPYYPECVQISRENEHI